MTENGQGALGRRLRLRRAELGVTLDLRGFGPAGQPVDPGDAVCSFLDALGVPSARIPVRPDAQAELYRSLLAGRRVLVLLDNASDASQVRPLLPGGAGCLALITSRGQLTGLAVAEGARPVPLDPLGPAEARDLLALRLGAARLATEPRAADRLVELTAGLPLALSITAARAAAHPAATLAGVAAGLEDARSRLGGLDGGEASADVRAAFSWSYRRLSGPAARLFLLLGVHPGPDISLAAVASLAGRGGPAARQALAELTAGGLVTEPVPGRFGCHDLLRSYAAELSADGTDGAANPDAPASPDCAISPDVDGTAAGWERLLDHYLHTAHAGMLRLEIVPGPLPPRHPGAEPEDLATEAAAQDWFRAEHDVLIAVVAEAARTGRDQHAWLLPATMTKYLLSSSRWHEWAANQRTGLAAAQRLGDERAQARAHRGLGYALACLRHDEADAHLRRALGLYQRVGDLTGEAYTHATISGMLDMHGRHREAIPHVRQSLELFRAAGSQIGEALALGDLGWAQVNVGEYADAIRCCEEALRMCRAAGNHTLTGAVLDSLGLAHLRLGHFAEAVRHYQLAVGEYQLIGHRLAEGCTLGHLGDAQASSGDQEAVTRSWRQALDILGHMHHRRVAELRAKLSPAG